MLSKDEKLDPIFKEKTVNFMCFESLVRYKIDLETGNIVQPIYNYLSVSKVYPKKCLVNG